MNARRGLMWWVFWTGAALVLAALAWASIAVARLERRNEAARQTVQHQEVIRLALWRVDSQLAPIIAMEAARAPAAIGNLALRSDAVLGRSAAPFVEGFWNIDAANNITATDPRNRTIGGKVAEEQSTLVSAAETATPALAAADVAPSDAPEPSAAFDYQVRRQVADIAQRVEPSADRSAPTQSKVFSLMESAPSAAPPATFARSAGLVAADDPAPIPAARLEPRWVETAPDRVDLVLVRSIPTEAGPVTEGVTLDWDALRATLENSLADLIPGALLLPASGAAADQIERDGRGFRLATVPALLVPGEFSPVVPFRMTPALWALVITWMAMLGALAAVGLVLRATMRLSDRRAKFVGAVTHELRTPLTTFRLYAQMLAGGMVTDDKARAEYLGTLERESIRLAEIVENVLEYARLTRRRPGAARPPGERSISASELLARVRPVVSRRAEQSGMDLIVSVEPGVDGPGGGGAGRTVTCDPRSVERILMNLVENACKYALPAPQDPDAEDADTRVHLDLSATDRHLEILIADHGPGIPRRERERVFGEFQRGPGAAESSRPGLGLGLALSRGLAREMGGDLRLVRRRAHGAEFLLTIPLDPAGQTTPAAPARPAHPAVPPSKPTPQPTPDSRA
jgi:signal transduction histidine kinase